MKEPDVRTRFTQKVLRESLLTLMKEKSILSVSVKEICAGAGVSRSTFYAYCRNQYDLLRQIEDEVLAEAEDLFREHFGALNSKSSGQEFARIEDILNYIVKNNSSIQVLIGENGDPRFQRRFFENQIEHLRYIKQSSSGKESDEKSIRYQALFAAGGFVTLIQEWLKNDMDMPVQELRKLLVKLARAAFT